MSRELNGHVHDPTLLLQRIERVLARQNENKEVAPALVETAARLAEISVADMVVKPAESIEPTEAELKLEATRQAYIDAGVIKPNDYWDDAPNNLAPANIHAYTDKPAPLADRFIPEKYVSQAPVLPNASVES
jgi:hypothetical protein